MSFGQNTFFLVGAITLALAALSTVWLVLLELRLRRLFRGRRAKDLEDVLKSIQKELANAADKETETERTLENIEKRLKRTVQNVGLVRFNPYSGAGGNQSFALAVLDQQKNGFVITNLYNRESSRIYAKPVVGAESEHQMSEEEKQAIAKALG